MSVFHTERAVWSPRFRLWLGEERDGIDSRFVLEDYCRVKVDIGEEEDSRFRA